MSNGIIRYGISIALLSLVSSKLFGRLLVFSVLDAVVLDCGVLEVVDIEVVAIEAGSSVVVGTSAIDVTGMLWTILPEVVNSFSFTPYSVVDCNTTLLSTSGASLLLSNFSNWMVVLGMRVASFALLKMMGITVLTGNSVLFAMSLPGADVFLVAVVIAKDVLCSGRKSGVACL